MKIRKPNKVELLAIAKVEHKKTGVDFKQQLEFLSGSFVSVTDEYITDSVGYQGKVISVVWSGSPTIYTVYIMDDNKLVRVKPELTDLDERCDYCKEIEKTPRGKTTKAIIDKIYNAGSEIVL